MGLRHPADHGLGTSAVLTIKTGVLPTRLTKVGSEVEQSIPPPPKSQLTNIQYKDPLERRRNEARWSPYLLSNCGSAIFWTQAQNHVKYLLKIHILGPPSQLEFNAFGMETRNPYPISQKNGEIAFIDWPGACVRR